MYIFYNFAGLFATCMFVTSLDETIGVVWLPSTGSGAF